MAAGPAADQAAGTGEAGQPPHLAEGGPVGAGPAGGVSGRECLSVQEKTADRGGYSLCLVTRVRRE